MPQTSFTGWLTSPWMALVALFMFLLAGLIWLFVRIGRAEPAPGALPPVKETAARRPGEE